MIITLVAQEPLAKSLAAFLRQMEFVKNPTAENATKILALNALGWGTYTAVMTLASILLPGAGFFAGLLITFGAGYASSWINTQAGQFWVKNISILFN